MSTIRPFQPPAAPLAGRPAVRGGAEAEPVKAAQRAFFQAALGEADAGPQGPRPEPTRRVEPKPLDGLPRPGSLLDIRV